MQISLPERGSTPLSPPELVDLAAKAKEAHGLMRSAYEGFNKRADEIRSEISRRYSSDSFNLLSPQDRRRMSEHESAGRIFEARKQALADMDAVAKKQIAPILHTIVGSKSFYKSAALSISRSTLDSERRLRIASNLAQSGPADVWHAAVVALQKADAELAAAVIQVVNGMDNDKRPFSAGDFASRFAYAPHEAAVKAINGINQDTQAALNVWQMVRQGKTGRLGDVSGALWTNVVQEAGVDAVDLGDDG